MMENCVKRVVQSGRTLLLVFTTSAVLSGCLLNSVPVPVVYGDGASYSPYSMPKLKNGERVITVEPGDTVSELASRYKMDFAQFTSRNDLRKPYVIYPGQRLVLPPWSADYDSTAPMAVASNRSSSQTKTVTIGGKRQVVSVTLKEPEASPVNRTVAQATRVAPSGGGSIPTPGIKPQDYAAVAAREMASERTWQVASSDGDTPIAGQGSSLRKDVVIAEPANRKGFIWPVQGKVVLKYGASTGGLFNDGINIQANRGSPILAAENGVVTYVGNELRGFGNLILIKHADNYVTAYAHTENPLVARGDVVTRGQRISSVGTTGAVTFPQLHFEVRRGRKSSDPMQYLPSVMVSR
ncbi:peptidoglycan DD-metalloendopeptidase family protein [Thalassospira sp.]|uniref:peptidoglycan DD-metalloendopeptidase family protein n=1 Tax=Thalassospira sp. TaxID=1912094 RepID=UPI0032EB3010